MTRRILNKKTTWLAILVLCAALTSAAWASHEKLLLPFPGQPLFQNQPASNDSTPKKSKPNTTREKKDRTGDEGDLDKAIEDLEKAILNLKLVLKNKNWENYKNALDDADWDLISSDKIRRDWEKSQMEWEKAMKGLEPNLALQELINAREESLHAFDMEKLHKELEHSQFELQENLGKMDLNLSKMNDELRNAELHLHNADIEMKNLHSFIDELKKDGLIKRGKEYEIKIEKGELFIDGKKQPDGVTDKYRNNEKYKKFFDKDNNFSLKSDGRDDDDWL